MKEKPAFVWAFDHNLRVYEELTPGDRQQGRLWSSREIWRGKWRKKPVTGETRVSWVINHHQKVPKNGRHNPRLFAFSTAEILAQELVVKRYLLEAALRDASVEQLMRVAEILGWTMPEPVWPKNYDGERF